MLIDSLDRRLRSAVINALKAHGHDSTADELSKLPHDIKSFDGISREVVTILCAVELISGEIHHTMQAKG